MCLAKFKTQGLVGFLWQRFWDGRLLALQGIQSSTQYWPLVVLRTYFRIL